MSKTRRGLSLLLCLVMVVSLFAGMPIMQQEAQAADTNTNQGNDSTWVCAWHTSPLWLNGDSKSNLSTAVTALSLLRERTFRTRIQVTMGGDTVRLTYSNQYGTAPLEIGEITLAHGSATDVNAITDTPVCVKAKDGANVFSEWNSAHSDKQVTKGTSYYGDTVYVIPAGATVTTNAIDIRSLGLDAMDYLTVSTWITNMNKHKDGITGGLIGGKTTYLGLSLNFSGGDYNHTERKNLRDVGVVNPIDLWNEDDTGEYNIIPYLTNIDIKRSSITGMDDTSDAYATVIFGDSTLANNIPLNLETRLLSNDIQGVSFVWAAVKGNELLMNGQSSAESDGSSDKNGTPMDEAAIKVIDEVVALEGVKKIIVKVGINDILHPNCDDLDSNYAHQPSASEIIAGYKYLIQQAHANGIEVYFYELTPWDGYTRNDTLNYSDSIDDIRREVNAWLATYGDKYDNRVEGKNNDTYTGSVTVGNNNYGSTSHTQACDSKYDYSKHVTINHSARFDSFGYISLESLGDTSHSATMSVNGKDQTTYTKMQSKYTTDGIHYTHLGQLKVSNLTPLSIFRIQEEVNQDGQEVVIPNVFVASKAESLKESRYYYICSTEGATANCNSTANQETAGQLATAKATKTTGEKSGTDGADYYGTRYAYFNAIQDIETKETTVQRGVSTAPYIIGSATTSNSDYSLWQFNKYTESNKTSNYWINSASNNYLGFFYSGFWGALTYNFVNFTTGTIDHRPDDSSGALSDNREWFTFDKVYPLVPGASTKDGRASNGEGYLSELYYKASTNNKTFTFQARNYGGDMANRRTDGSIKSGGTESTQRWLTVREDRGYHGVCLFLNTTGEVRATMDLAAPSAWGNEAAKDTYVLTGYSGTKQATYILSDNMPNGLDQVESHVNNGSDAALGNKADGNGKFNGYTYGYDQRLYWKAENHSDDGKNVATVDQNGNVTVTGNAGEAVITANYFWKEYDGYNYIWETYTTDQYNDFIKNGQKPATPASDTTTENRYHWVEIADGQWVYTNYKYLTSSLKIQQITDYKVDILADGDAGENDNVYYTNVYSGQGASLEAIVKSNPSFVYLPDGEWRWNFSGNGYKVSETKADTDDSKYADVIFDGTSGTITATATYYKTGSDTPYNNPYDGAVVTSTIKLHTTAAAPNIWVEVDDIDTTSYNVPSPTEGKNVKLNAYKWYEMIGGNKIYPAVDAGSESWTWTFEQKPADGSTGNVISFNGSTGTELNGSVVQQGTVKATCTYSYKQNGVSGSVTDEVLIFVNFGVMPGNTFIDFGLPVKIDLSALASFKVVDAISNGDHSALKESRLYDNHQFTGTSITADDYTAVLNDSRMTYTPTKISNGEKNTIYYEAVEGSQYRYSKVDIIPATSIYYEDSFVTFGEFDSNWSFIADNSKWSTAGREFTDKFASVNKDVYGYDEAYGQYTQYSMGSARHVTVNNEYGSNLPTYTGNYPAASFTFKGTGFAIYSTSDTNAGYVDVEITGAKGYYKYEATNAYAVNDFDQTPTLQYLNLPYDTYTVTLSVVYDKTFDGNKDGSYTYYLDAIRIYEPMKDDADTQAAYKEVGEDNVEFKSIRGMLISANTFNGLNDKLENGAVFLDSTFTSKYDADGVTVIAKELLNTSVADYKNYGPKNEVYLKDGQGVAFNISNAASLTDIQIGIKQAGAVPGSVYINGKEIEIRTATDMYYSIKDLIGADGNVVIVSNGMAPISITVLKTTGNASSAPAKAMVSVSHDTGTFAANRIMMLMAPPVDPTEPPVDPTEPVVEPTDDPQTTDDPEPTDDPQPTDDPEPTDDPQPTDDPGDDDSGKTSVIVKIVTAIKNFFVKLFGGK